MRPAIASIFVMLFCCNLSFAALPKDYTLSNEEYLKIEAKIEKLKASILSSYNYESLSDLKFKASAEDFLDKAKSYMKKEQLIYDVDQDAKNEKQTVPVDNATLTKLLGFNRDDLIADAKAVQKVYESSIINVVILMDVPGAKLLLDNSATLTTATTFTKATTSTVTKEDQAKNNEEIIKQNYDASTADFLNSVKSPTQTSYSISVEERAKIDADLILIKERIKAAYEYEEAGDVEFRETVDLFINRARTNLEQLALVNKAEKDLTTGTVAATGLTELDAAVKESLGYSRKDVEAESSRLQRSYRYNIYNYTLLKNVDADKYSGWAKLKDLVANSEVLNSGKTTAERIETLLTTLQKIRKDLIYDQGTILEKAKQQISIEAFDYISQSETDVEPLKVYSSTYKKEEVFKYAMTEKKQMNLNVQAKEVEQKISTLEFMKTQPKTYWDKDAENVLKGMNKYVLAYTVKAPLTNAMYTTWKTTESSLCMMAALGVQDIFFYKFPDLFLSKEKAAFYKQFTNDTFTQYMKDRFGSSAPYKSFGAFVITSHFVRAVPTPSIILKISKWADSKFWGVGGTRVRGLALFAISMTLASKVSEAVSLYNRFSGELNFDDQGLSFILGNPDLENVQAEINSLTWSYLGKNVWYSWNSFAVSTGNFLGSFALSEMILKEATGRLIPWGYYGAKSKLNKTKCNSLLNGIENAMKKSPKPLKYTGNIFKTIFIDGLPMFLLASKIETWMEAAESHFINNEAKEKEIGEILKKLILLEYDLLGTGMKAYIESRQDRLSMYNKLDDLSMIEDVVEYLRKDDGWVIGTIGKKFDDASKTIEEKNKDVDEFLVKLFDTIKGSKMNPAALSALEAQYKSNADYKATLEAINSEENKKQLENYYNNAKDLIAKSDDPTIKPLSELNTDVMVAISSANQQNEFIETKFFSDIRSGTWGADQKAALTQLMQKQHEDDYQDYVTFYSTALDSALNYSGTASEKLLNLFEKLYPKFIEDPLMTKNDYADFQFFGEDLLNAVVFSIYDDFMKGVYTLPKDSDKYWTYMDAIMSSTVKIALYDDSYTYRAFSYLKLTLFFTLSAPYDNQTWRSFKEWKALADNTSKTYKDYAYAQWKEENPKKGDKSFETFAYEKWKEIVAATLTDDQASGSYKVWKFRRNKRGL